MGLDIQPPAPPRRARTDMTFNMARSFLTTINPIREDLEKLLADPNVTDEDFAKELGDAYAALLRARRIALRAMTTKD
jgi:hypothetical protein